MLQITYSSLVWLYGKRSEQHDVEPFFGHASCELLVADMHSHPWFVKDSRVDPRLYANAQFDPHVVDKN